MRHQAIERGDVSFKALLVLIVVKVLDSCLLKCPYRSNAVEPWTGESLPGGASDTAPPPRDVPAAIRAIQSLHK
jgi:hypothetical protein